MKTDSSLGHFQCISKLLFLSQIFRKIKRKKKIQEQFVKELWERRENTNKNDSQNYSSICIFSLQSDLLLALFCLWMCSKTCDAARWKSPCDNTSSELYIKNDLLQWFCVIYYGAVSLRLLLVPAKMWKIHRLRSSRQNASHFHWKVFEVTATWILRLKLIAIIYFLIFCLSSSI